MSPSWLSTFFCILAALCFSSAVPVEANHQLHLLTHSDFDESISQGLWFIEFFSPYCFHCKRFRSTWEQLASDKASYQPFGFNIAQVDCIAQGDLCHAQNVEYYPQLSLYRQGELVEVYHGNRVMEDLSSYVDRHVQEFSRSYTQASGAPTRVPNELGIVTRLDSTSFDAAVKDGLLFVKMFAPWCGHCKALAPVWTQLASRMKGVISIAEVNCDDNRSLCVREGVTGYPTLLLYQNGKRIAYRDSRSLSSLEDWVMRVVAAASGLEQLNFEDLEGTVKMKSVFFVYLKSPSSPDGEISVILEAAQSQLEGPPVYRAEDPGFFRRFSLDAGEGSFLILFRDHVSIPADSLELTGRFTSRDLHSWMVHRRFPSAFELTSANFQDVMHSELPSLVILVAVDELEAPSAQELLSEMSVAWKAQFHSTRAFFVWMNAEKWGSWLSRMYGFRQSKSPFVVIADHKRLAYYDVDKSNRPLALDIEQLLPGIQDAFDGKLPIRYSENSLERLLKATQAGIHRTINWITRYIFVSVLLGASALFILYVCLRKGLSGDRTEASLYRKGKGDSRLD